VRGWPLRAALWALLPLVLVAGAELAARYFVPLDVLVYRDSLNPNLRFELLPGAEGVKNDARVKISRQGLRGDEVPVEKAPGEFRIAVVGDHASFGIGVEQEDIYAERLKSLVPSPAGGPVTVVNLSMYHYGTEQKIEFLRLRAPEFQPDFLVMQVHPGDDVAFPEPKYKWPKLKNYFRRHSRLARAVMERAFWRRPPTPPPDAAPSETAPPRSGAERFADYLRETNISGVVVFVPEPDREAERAAASDEYRRKVQQECRAAGVPFYDAGEAFRWHPPQELLRFKEGPFLSPLGHRVLAEAVAGEVRRRLKERPPLRRQERGRSRG
jgi:hypothetical protein